MPGDTPTTVRTRTGESKEGIGREEKGFEGMGWDGMGREEKERNLKGWDKIGREGKRREAILCSMPLTNLSFFHYISVMMREITFDFL